MRITSQIIDRRALQSIQKSLSALQEAQLQASSGQRVQNASDDPGAYVSILSADHRLTTLEQYRRNIAGAEARLAAEESALGQLTDLLSRARELAISQAGASGNAATRLTTKAEVDQIFQAVVALGNTRHGGGFLFGGDFDDRAPFAADGSTSTTTPPSGTRKVETAAGQLSDIGHDALRTFVDSGVIAALQRLSNALGTDSSPEIDASLTELTDAFDRVQDVLGETGASARNLEMAAANVDALSLSLRTLRADLSEVELEEAISRLVSRQTAYQTALMATSRMISTNLSDYLR